MTDFKGYEIAGEPIDFNTALQLTKRLIHQTLTATPAPFRPRTGYLAQAHGKFLRAYAILACAEDETGVRMPATKAAAAVELLHLATLVHDDVIDNADTRRGLPTLMKKFGKRQAVISGDYIFCLALRLAADAAVGERDLNEDLPNIMEKICMGELLQSMNNRNFALSGNSYLRIISGKTAALFEGSFYAGAMLCAASRPQARQYASIGWHLGMIFQLADDCMDYEATEQQAKKPVQSDYEQGVVTLPLIVAMKEKSAIRLRADAGSITKEEIRQAVLDSGGITFTRRIAKIYYDRAMDLLSAVNAPAFKKERIASLLFKALVGQSSQMNAEFTQEALRA
jgi:heptaprenyl diphosphate synthase